MSTVVGDLLWKVDADVSGFRSAMDTASTKMGGFKDKMGGVMGTFSSLTQKLAVASTAIAGVGAALGVGIVRSGMKSAATLEQNRIAFEVMLGSAEKAGAVLKDITAFAAETPFELPEIQTSAKSLLAFGVAAEDLKPALKSIGDIASGVGAPIGELSELYGKAKTQGRLFAEDINQLTGRGIPIIQELAAQFGVSTTEVKKLVEEGKIGFPELEKGFQNMTGEGGQFYNLMEKQSKSFTGIVSNLKDTFGSLAKAILGVDAEGNIKPGGLFDKFKNIAQQLLTVVMNNKEAIAAWGEKVLTKFAGYLGTVVDVAMNLISNFQGVKTIFLDVVKQFVEKSPVFAFFKTLFGTIVDLFKDKLFPALVENKDMFITIGKVLGGVLLVAVGASMAIFAGFIDILTKVINVAGGIYDFFFDKIPSAFARAGDYAQSLWDKLSGVFSVAGKVAGVIPGLGGLSALADAAGSVGGLNSGGMATSHGLMKFAEGGIVPGNGNRDKVPALLTPGEIVFNPAKGQGISKTEINFNNAVVRTESDLETIRQTIRQVLSRDIELTRYGIF